MKIKAGTKVGPWIVGGRLGEPSGNGDVWKVAHESSDAIGALKVLKRKHSDNSSRSTRFAFEIDALERCAEVPGILGLLDDHRQHPDLETPSEPWFVAELATPLLKELGPEPTLETVVEACCSYALTLAEIHALGMSHRDIKPANLFYGKDGWLIGDFGLVELPDRTGVSEPHEKIGPLFYLAPEMLVEVVERQAPKADVYSLAQLLWKLATGQNFPYPGTLTREMPGLSLGVYVNTERASELDALLERATQPDPAHRPPMEVFASELQSWIGAGKKRPASGTGTEQTASIKDRLTAIYRPILEQRRSVDESRNQRDKLKSDAKAALTRSEYGLLEMISDLDSEVRGAGLSTEFTTLHNSSNWTLLTTALEHDGLLDTPESGDTLGPARFAVGSLAYPPMMTSSVLTSFMYGVAVEVSATEKTARCVAAYLAHHFWRGRLSPSGHKNTSEVIWSSEKSFVLEGPSQAVAISDLASDLRSQLTAAMSDFLDVVEDYEEVRPTPA